MTAARVTELITPLIESFGLTLVGVEHVRTQNAPMIRIYIDKQDGVTIDECGRVGTHISPLLSAENILTKQTGLEISSPGLDRPFFSLAQCVPFVGQTVRAILHTPLTGKRRITGILDAADDTTHHISILHAEETYRIPWQSIKKIHLVYTPHITVQPHAKGTQ